MTRPGYLLRDAALSYASRGIPVLPLHYPVAHLRSADPVPDGRVIAAQVWTACSCGDPVCGQVGKHPLGSLAPHGLREATTNRARVLAWWTRHPLANIGLATGHRFDVLDVDGPEGEQTIRAFAAEHGLVSSGPLVRTGGGGWHYYLAPTGLGNVHPRDLQHVDWRGRGGYVVAPPSRHVSGHAYQFMPGRDMDAPLVEVPAPLREQLQRRERDRLAAPVVPIPLAGGPAHPYTRAALAEELGRVATAPKGERNRRLWEAPATSTTSSPAAPSKSARSTRDCLRRPSAAACSVTSPARPAAPSSPPVRSAWPTPARSPNAPNATMPRRRRPPSGAAASPPTRGGEVDGRCRPPGRLTWSEGGRVPPPSRARAHPPPRRKEPAWAAPTP